PAARQPHLALRAPPPGEPRRALPHRLPAHQRYRLARPHPLAPWPATRLRGGLVMTTLLSTSAPSVVFPASADVAAIIRLALAEDMGRGDLTTEPPVPPDALATAEILQKAPGVVCGLPVVEAVFHTLDPRVVVEPLADEGSYAAQRRSVARLTGAAP